MMASSRSTSINSYALTQLFHRFSQTRGVWLRSTEPLSSPTRRLIDASRFAGMQLDVLTYAELPVIPFWRYDLIVLEQVDDHALSAMLSCIRRARTLSKAPLVVLVGQAAPEATIAGLRAGADAVTSIQASEQVLLAQWCAIMKRWKPA